MEIKNTKLHRTEDLRRVKLSKAREGSEVFSLPLDDLNAPAQTEALAETFVLDGLVALQEADTHELNKKAAQKHGENLLDSLDDLRQDLILGSVPIEKLHHIAKTIQTKRKSVVDPKLQMVIDEIELRAKVEIAKYEMQSRSI